MRAGVDNIIKVGIYLGLLIYGSEQEVFQILKLLDIYPKEEKNISCPNFITETTIIKLKYFDLVQFGHGDIAVIQKLKQKKNAYTNTSQFPKNFYFFWCIVKIISLEICTVINKHNKRDPRGFLYAPRYVPVP